MCSYFKDIIVGESNLQFSRDIFLETHPSFDHYGDSDVEDQEHISSFLSEFFNYDGQAYHSNGSESQRYSKEEDIHEKSIILNLYDGDHGFDDPMATLLESYLLDSLKLSDFIIPLVFDSECDLLKEFLWSLLCFYYYLLISGIKISLPVMILLVWLHWKHDFTGASSNTVD